MSFFSRYTKERPYCPQIKGHCVRERCVHWGEFQLAESPAMPQAVSTYGDCMLNWPARFLYDAHFAMRGQQAAIESLRNETVEATNALGILAQLGRHVTESSQQKRLNSGRKINGS